MAASLRLQMCSRSHQTSSSLSLDFRTSYRWVNCRLVGLSLGLAAAMVKERHIQCLNIMSGALKDVIKTSENRNQLAEHIGRELGTMHHAYHRQRGRDVLNAGGADARAALPFINSLIEQKEESIKKAKADQKEEKLIKADQNELVQLEKTKKKLTAKEKK